MPNGNSNMPSHVLLVGTMETGFKAYAVSGLDADISGVDMPLDDAFQIVPLMTITPPPVPAAPLAPVR